MEGTAKQIERYVTREGKVPFSEWFNSLRDIRAKLKITKRLDRVELGNLGDFKSLGDGIFELRIDYGAGYRIYFGQVGSLIVLLLCGGDKKHNNRIFNKQKYTGKIIKEVQKMAKSLSYHEHLIDFLSDPKTSAAYLEDIIRDNEGEPRLLSLGLRNIAEALGRSKFSEAELKEHQDKINDILNSHGDDAIYRLEEWLRLLGLQLSIAVIEQEKASLTLNNNSEAAMVTLG